MSMTRCLGPLLGVALSCLVLVACSAGAPEPEPTPAPAAPAPLADDPTPTSIRVRVNHCFVETLTFDGERWNVPFRGQFGDGGSMPPGWKGRGVIERVSEAEARYTDDGGTTLVFRLADDPSVKEVESAVCM